MRGVTPMVWSIYSSSAHFNSHASCEAWQCVPFAWKNILTISTHTPHARRDFLYKIKNENISYFNSHASCETWHTVVVNFLELFVFQLTRLMRGVTQFIDFFLSELSLFQLTRLMRGVTLFDTTISNGLKISTHTPHARRDSTSCPFLIVFPKFQLTRLMRGVTAGRKADQSKQKFQLTRLMRGVTFSHFLTPSVI